MKNINSLSISTLLLFALVFTFTQCTEGVEIEEKNYNLVWSDDFEGPAGQLPDDTKWAFDIGTGWGNNQ
ncbi:MAG: glycoside hydrolase family 16 protein, partial [Saprospiraceae bacterium]